MFPAQELKRLVQHKQILRLRIARERFDCITAATAAARPVRWLDSIYLRWQRVTPLTKLGLVPLFFFLKRKFFPAKKHENTGGGWRYWVPLAWRLTRWGARRVAGKS